MAACSVPSKSRSSAMRAGSGFTLTGCRRRLHRRAPAPTRSTCSPPTGRSCASAYGRADDHRALGTLHARRRAARVRRLAARRHLGRTAGRRHGRADMADRPLLGVPEMGFGTPGRLPMPSRWPPHSLLASAWRYATEAQAGPNAEGDRDSGNRRWSSAQVGRVARRARRVLATTGRLSVTRAVAGPSEMWHP